MHAVRPLPHVLVVAAGILAPAPAGLLLLLSLSVILLLFAFSTAGIASFVRLPDLSFLVGGFGMHLASYGQVNNVNSAAIIGGIQNTI